MFRNYVNTQSSYHLQHQNLGGAEIEISFESSYQELATPEIHPLSITEDIVVKEL